MGKGRVLVVPVHICLVLLSRLGSLWVTALLGGWGEGGGWKKRRDKGEKSVDSEAGWEHDIGAHTDQHCLAGNARGGRKEPR